MAQIFTTFAANQMTDAVPVEVKTGLWSPDETGSLGKVYTSSIQKDVSGEYYYDVYNLDPSNTANNAEIQFSIAYGHVSGGGSPPVANTVLGGNSVVPTQAIYSQYRNILLSNGTKFKFGENLSDDIYVININRARMKQALDPGNWELGLSGSNGIRTFIDDFGSNTVVGNTLASTAYQIRSGSLRSGLATSDTTIYGTVYPDYGAIVLYPAAISASVGFSGSTSTTLNAHTLLPANVPFAPYTGSNATDYQYQHEALYRSISGSIAKNTFFFARSVEKVTSKNYAVNIPFDSYNYTNNPTFYSASADGTLQIREVFRDNPKTYITTIGLYNSTNDLVAVAKLSRPLQKSRDKTLTIRVRLDY